MCLLEKDDDNTTTTATTTDAAYCDETIFTCNNEDTIMIDEISTVSQCSLFCFEMATAFDHSVANLFHELLTPFIEVRKGCIFLDIGEEMLVI